MAVLSVAAFASNMRFEKIEPLPEVPNDTPTSTPSRLKAKTRETQDQGQHERFIEADRELGCDDDEATFKAKLAVIARQKPKDERDPLQGTPPPKSEV